MSEHRGPTIAQSGHHLSSGAALARSPRAHKRWFLVAAAVVVALAVVAYAKTMPNKQAEHVVSIGPRLSVSPNGRTLNFNVTAGCLPTTVVRARVDEGPKVIRIEARAKNDYTPPGDAAPSCAEGAQVRLRRPLDGRIVIDNSTGKAVPLESGR
jgi:hypothetical protein